MYLKIDYKILFLSQELQSILTRWRYEVMQERQIKENKRTYL